MLEMHNGELQTMASTQIHLKQLESNLDESIGVRESSAPRLALSPVASPKNIGRKPLRNAGQIRIDQVIPDPSQPRTEFSKESIRRLAQSLRKKQLVLIRVRWSAMHDKWVIVNGERRWRAAREAGLKTIDCIFDEEDRSEAEILEEQLIENLQREDLSAIEQARGFSALMELHSWNGKQVAEFLHVPESTVSRSLALLDLPPNIQERVDSGEIAARSAYEISKVPDETKQQVLAARAAGGMTVEQTRNAVRTRPKRRKSNQRGSKRLEFQAENGWVVIAIPPTDPPSRTYHHLQEALDHVAEDVQTRINANIRVD
jgi:ParB family chromosome partitioning protein